MQRSIEVFRRRRVSGQARLLGRIGLLLALLLVPVSQAMALIMGGEGNSPVTDPGWPAGAAKVFNSPSRIAWWEGPPLGGGEWHAECRGNTAAFQEALEAFARIESEKKRLVIHDGEGASFWLNTNNDPEKKAAAVADWIFVIWQPQSWKRIQAMPVDLRGPSKKGETGPVPQIDVYVGGRIIWSDVEVPKGIEIVDERLEAHGFDVADGSVLEGNIVELPGDKPVAAKVTLQKVEPNPAGATRTTRPGQSRRTPRGTGSSRRFRRGGSGSWRKLLGSPLALRATSGRPTSRDGSRSTPGSPGLPRSRARSLTQRENRSPE